jgi:hypothetical protein
MEPAVATSGAWSVPYATRAFDRTTEWDEVDPTGAGVPS